MILVFIFTDPESSPSGHLPFRVITGWDRTISAPNRSTLLLLRHLATAPSSGTGNLAPFAVLTEEVLKAPFLVEPLALPTSTGPRRSDVFPPILHPVILPVPLERGGILALTTAVGSQRLPTGLLSVPATSSTGQRAVIVSTPITTTRQSSFWYMSCEFGD